MTGWELVGMIVAVGLPLAVIIGTLCWPQRIPKGRSVREIQQRIEEEGSD